MLKHLKDRNVQFGIICILCLSILAGQLAYLTVEKGDELYEKSLMKKRVEVNLKGTRGNILDRHGIPLAINRQIYTLQLDRQQIPSSHEEINGILLQMLETIYKNSDEDTLLDLMPIRSHSQGAKFYYAWKDEEQEIQDKRYDNWSKEIGVKEKLDADQMMEHLRQERYEIDDEISDEMALAIISIRLNIFARRFTQYEPIPIAVGISSETVVQIETFAPDMPGVQTIVDSGRFYPMGTTSSHIIGYLGSIGKDQSQEYQEKGYDISSDKIGKVGIEAYAEKWLTGNRSDRLGKLIAEKDSFGKVIRVLEEIPSQNGDNVVLTIDNELQRAVTNILKEEIAKMREGLPPYQEKNIAPLAKEGAAVVLDVHSGEILSIVSYPSFDPNSPSKEGNQYSLAFQGSAMPGSVMKMMTGIAGLMEGVVTLDEKIYDRVDYDKYDKNNPRKCWDLSGHGNENFVDALKHSCNYYFYEVADRLGIEPITKWAELFGLDGNTGIEILNPNNDRNTIPSEATKISNRKGIMRSEIKVIMRSYGYFGRQLTEEEEQYVEELVDFPLSEDRSAKAGQDEVKEIADMLRSMGYTDKADLAASKIRSDVLVQHKRWTPTETILAGIGQGIIDISPLAMARYIAALANGGKVLETHLVKKVVTQEGRIIEETQPVIMRELNINQEYIDAALEGMWKVVNDPHSTPGENDGGGSAVAHFEDMDPNITVAGKTGTAQVVPDKEERNNAWFTAITPYENPEIAVVVVIPNGRSSGNAAPVARRIIDEYYRQKAQRRSGDIPSVNEIQP